MKWTKKQKDIFLNGEGDAWFERNHQAVQAQQLGFDDPIISALSMCLASHQGPHSLIEVGCGEGRRLQWISQNLGITCQGVEPSLKAVKAAQANGLAVVQGTADTLNFDSNSFDFIVYGFCLYLCDREDLFKISAEAHRVLKPSGWIIIRDFFSTAPTAREYHHLPGLFSYKMDYRQLFDWHPDYTCLSHEVCAHACSSAFTDARDEWVATSVLRRNSQPC